MSNAAEENCFDPSIHRLVARKYKDGQPVGTPVHVSLGEVVQDAQGLSQAMPLLDANQLHIQSTGGLVSFQDRDFEISDLPRLTLDVGLANNAIINGVEAGDLGWHTLGERYSWPDAEGAHVPMDHQTLIEFARAVSAALRQK